jgi:phosphoribosylformimino-5-aminoimidazole carboxamide ribonucleotide (ProFAR) isomerase
VRGWTESAAMTAEHYLGQIDTLPLAAVLVTDVAREGRMLGADAARFTRLAAASRHPLIASGGITGVGDLEALRAAGIAGVVLGMALYTGTLSVDDITGVCAA